MPATSFDFAAIPQTALIDLCELAMKKSKEYRKGVDSMPPNAKKEPPPVCKTENGEGNLAISHEQNIIPEGNCQAEVLHGI